PRHDFAGRQVLQRREGQAVVEVVRHFELAARRLVMRPRLVAPALPVEGDLDARKGGTALRQAIRLQPEDAALGVRRVLVVDGAVLELEEKMSVDDLAARFLSELAVADLRALGRADGEESTRCSLREPDPDRRRVQRRRPEDDQRRKEPRRPNAGQPGRPPAVDREPRASATAARERTRRRAGAALRLPNPPPAIPLPSRPPPPPP